ncbi:MAG: hypothetical protein ABH872_06905 [Candidatus Omnitrophota bacterium]
MEIKEIADKFLNLNIYDKRCIEKDYLELVFLSSEKEKWDQIFLNIFGAPLKPQGTKPTKEDLRLTDDYGGILTNQTLFKKEDIDRIVIAMLWPWQDGKYITLKISTVKK